MGQRRLTVVQTLPALESGGVERGTLEVSTELVRRGHRSIVISGGGRLAARVTEAGGEHVEWPIGTKSPLTLRLVPRLRRLLRDEGADILHARSRAPAWVSLLTWRKMAADARPRFVTTMHGLHSVSAYSAVMTRGERVIAVSETVKRHILDHYPKADPERIVVIPRGVDPAEFPHGHRPTQAWCEAFFAEHPETRGQRLIVLPGRLTRLKGHHELIRVIKALRDRDAPVCGVVVGGEDPKRRAYAAEIRAAAAELEPGAIVFTGARHDMPDMLGAADVVASFSTQPEAFGRTVLEALSLGRPVVGYDHGGVGDVLAELLPQGRVPLGDIEQAAERIMDFIEAPPAVPPNDTFTLRKMLDRTIALYEELAAERG